MRFTYLLFSFISLISLGHAVTHYVTPTGNGDASSWGSAGNLQMALASASSGDQIWIASGNYMPTMNGDRLGYFDASTANITIFGGFSGSETMLSQRDSMANPVVLSGDIGSLGTNTDNSFTVISINAANVILDSLSIQDGYGNDGADVFQQQGGGAYLSSSATGTIFRNVHFKNNSAQHGGAVVQPNASAGILRFENCYFENNMTTLSSGAIRSLQTLEVINTVFANNTATAQAGGAIVLSGAANSIFENSTFYGNSCGTDGGALWTDIAVMVKNSIMWNNTATNGTNTIHDTTSSTNTMNSLLSNAMSGEWPGGTLGIDGGNNVAGDPSFTDPTNINGPDGKLYTMDDGLTLSGNSPAIDAGLATSANMDILGKPLYGAPDIGAYEFEPELGYALSFDGTDDYVEIADAASNQFGGNISVGAWVNIDPTGTGMRMVVSKFLSNNGFYLAVNASDQLEFSVGAASMSNVITSTSTLSTNVWIHVGATYNSGTQKARLFVGGALEGSKMITEGLDLNNGSSLRVGRDTNTAGGYFKGAIDHVVLYNRSISPTKFSDMLTGSEFGLQAFYNFNEGTGVTTSDNTSNMNNGTITGGALWVASGGQTKMLPKVIYVKHNAMGMGDGSDWTNSANLHAALGMVNSGDELWLANSGNYNPGPLQTDKFMITKNNISLLGGFNGSETDSDQRDWIQNPTVISGEIQNDADVTNNADMLLQLSGNGLTLSGLIISDTDGLARGAGLQGFNVHSLTIENCIFQNNTADEGGAYEISLVSGGSNTIIRDSIFFNNHGNYGGGGKITGVGGFEIINSVYVQNSAVIGGAGLMTIGSGKVTNCTFYQNEDTDGLTSGEAGQLSFGTSGTGVIVSNSLFFEGNNTPNLSAWDNTVATIQNTHMDGGVSVGTIGTGNPSGVSFGAGILTSETASFSDNVNFKGLDGKWFTADDGLRLNSGSAAIDAGVVVAGVDMDILGQNYVNNPDLGAYEGGVAGPVTGPALVPYAGWSAPTEIATNTTNNIVLIFDLDTQNTGYSGNITELVFPVNVADPSVEFTSALVYELSQGGQVVSNTPTFSSSNISFTGLNHSISNAGNISLELKVSTATSFTAGNVDFKIEPTGIKLQDMANVTGTPIATGNIALVDPFQGLTFAAGSGLEPTNFYADNTSVSLMDMDFTLSNGSVVEVIEKIKINFTQGFVGSDIDMFEVFNGGTKVGEFHDFGSTWATNSNLGIAITGPTTLEIRGRVLSGATSGNLEYNINGSLIILAGGNILVQPTTNLANLAPINVGSPPATMLTFVSQTPVNGATGVDPTADLTISFDESLSGLGTGIFRIYENGSATYSYGAGSTELSTAGTTLTINPATDLLPNTNYHVTIDANMITGISGNQFGGFSTSGEWAFTTGAGNVGSGGNVTLSSTSFPIPTSINKGAPNQGLFEFILDNPTANDEKIDKLTVDLMGINAAADLDYFDLYYEPSALTLVGGNAMTGNVVSGNIEFMLNGHNLAAADNLFLKLRVTVNPGSPATQMQAKFGPMNVMLFGGNMVMGPVIDTGMINLMGGNTTGGNTAPMMGKTTRLALGQSSVYALSPIGDMFAEGSNSRFQISSTYGPEVLGGPQVGPAAIDSVKAGAEHLMVLKAGQVYVTGSNDYAVSQGFSDLTPISGLTGITMIESGAYGAYAYDSVGDQLYVWGKNNEGQLGNGSFTDIPSPTGITKPAGNIQSIAAGVDHVLMVIAGDLYGAGSDRFGQLAGIGNSPALTLIDNTMTWASVGAGGFHSFAVTANGDLYAFGKNSSGQLGFGNKSPFEASLTMVTGISPVLEATGGYEHSMILLTDGRVCTVGSNAQEQIGGFSGPETLVWYNVANYNDVTQISCGPYTSMFIRNDVGNEYVKLFGLLGDTPSNQILVFKSFSNP
jgi:alpha-tubulin suppressor-like RCC1 family protein